MATGLSAEETADVDVAEAENTTSTGSGMNQTAGGNMTASP